MIQKYSSDYRTAMIFLYDLCVLKLLVCHEDDIMDVTSMVLQSRCSEYGDGWQGW